MTKTLAIKGKRKCRHNRAGDYPEPLSEKQIWNPAGVYPALDAGPSHKSCIHNPRVVGFVEGILGRRNRFAAHALARSEAWRKTAGVWGFQLYGPAIEL